MGAPGAGAGPSEPRDAAGGWDGEPGVERRRGQAERPARVSGLPLWDLCPVDAGWVGRVDMYAIQSECGTELWACGPPLTGARCSRSRDGAGRVVLDRLLALVLVPERGAHGDEVGMRGQEPRRPRDMARAEERRALILAVTGAVAYWRFGQTPAWRSGFLSSVRVPFTFSYILGR